MWRPQSLHREPASLRPGFPTPVVLLKQDAGYAQFEEEGGSLKAVSLASRDVKAGQAAESERGLPVASWRGGRSRPAGARVTGKTPAHAVRGADSGVKQAWAQRRGVRRVRLLRL